jgi:hypothetical protein
MRTGNSPSPDGFGRAFFLRFWPTISEPLLGVLHDFHAGVADMAHFNQAVTPDFQKKTKC